MATVKSLFISEFPALCSDWWGYRIKNAQCNWMNMRAWQGIHTHICIALVLAEYLYCVWKIPGFQELVITQYYHSEYVNAIKQTSETFTSNIHFWKEIFTHPDSKNRALHILKMVSSVKTGQISLQLIREHPLWYHLQSIRRRDKNRRSKWTHQTWFERITVLNHHQ